MTIAEFNEAFPTNDACLDYVFKVRFGHLERFHRVKGRKCYANNKGDQIYPLQGTIFEKSTTSLVKWFYAIYLFSQAKNSISAAELSRQLGVTEKCGWRIARQIRYMMKQDTDMLSGVVEADETYVGGIRRLNSWKKNKVPVVGMLERGGRMRAKTLKGKSEYDICKFVEDNLKKGSTLYTDGHPVYNIPRGYKRGRVMHTKKEYVRGDIHTNSIEAFWSAFKRSMRGTHVSISPRHLQSYVDAAVFRWNYRTDPFSELLARI